MATQRQKKAFEETLVNLGNKGKALRKAGYSEAIVKNPKIITESKGWKELMDEYLPESLLAKKHKQLLEKEEILSTKEGIVHTGQIHSDVKSALDLAYKLRGSFKAEKVEITLPKPIADV